LQGGSTTEALHDLTEKPPAQMPLEKNVDAKDIDIKNGERMLVEQCFIDNGDQMTKANLLFYSLKVLA
jgi:hypothetical protein